MNVVTQKLATLFAGKRPEPSYPTLPLVAGDGESSVRGIYLLGEVGGTPLIKLGLNQGVDTVDRIHAGRDVGSGGDPELLDLVIVGAGSSGLGAAMRAHELGMRYQVLESERVAMTVVNMFRGKLLFAEPAGVPNKSSMWFEECTREELLERWRAQIARTGLRIHEHEQVTDIQREGDTFRVTTPRASYRAHHVLLCVGKAGNPRKAGVPGESEHATKVFHNLSDPAEVDGRNVFVYGGGDVAAEATLALCDTHRVTMVTIDQELVFPKKRNREALLAARDAGKLDLQLASRLERIDEKSVTYRDGGGEPVTVDNDVVFEMIGAELPLPFFRRVGIKLEGDWDIKRWLALGGVFAFVYTLYALKKFPEHPYSWPFNQLVDADRFYAGLRAVFAATFAPFAWLFDKQAYSTMLDTPWFQQGYLYSLAYTIVMAVFGWQALRRWAGVARDPRYQRYRFVTLIIFQIVFFLAANVIAVQAMSVQHSWRAWGLYQPWPLFFNTFHWWNESDPRAVLYGFVGAGLLGTFVAIPLAARRHGKRFCTWVCGCGGLAETLGDRWRHLAPKGRRSRAWEFQGAVVLVAAVVATGVTVSTFSTRADNPWAQAYSYVVDFWLVAVIPIALYPFFGGKVWCRYWCPLAAWNQVLAGWYGRLQIKSNDKCISCTQCSRYCQVGVDVMAFARNQEAFDNANSSCIQCGVCIDVCPMDVLEFDLSRASSASLPVSQAAVKP